MKHLTLLFLCCTLIGLTGCGKVVSDRSEPPTKDNQPEYLKPIAPGVEIIPIISAGQRAQNGYRMAGVPDGLGLLDNGDNTFTVLMNHEIEDDESITRAHGAVGSFVSRWVIAKPGHNSGSWAVLQGEDAIKQLQTWDASTRQYILTNEALGQLCSADLAKFSAFYNYKTLNGTQEKIYLTGEEIDAEKYGRYGRAFAIFADGESTGQTFELPKMGRMAFENTVASPWPQQKTIVVLLDDAAGTTPDTLGEVYIYIGTKQGRGTPLDKAGLTNGKLYGISVDKHPIEDYETGLHQGQQGERFQLKPVEVPPDDNGELLFELTKANNGLGITKFLRPEDGVWDPNQKNVFYFVTTGSRVETGGKDGVRVGEGRLWGLRFFDIEHPENGGVIELLLDGNEGVRAPDNITATKSGKIIIQEDLGKSASLSRIWQFSIATKKLTPVAEFNKEYFQKDGRKFITTDEESSGIVDASEIIGPGWYLLTAQSHVTLTGFMDLKNRRKFNYSTGDGREVVEDGQLLAIFIPE